MEEDGKISIRAAWNPCVEVRKPSPTAGSKNPMDYVHAVPCESVQSHLCGGRVFIHRDRNDNQDNASCNGSIVMKKKEEENDHDEDGPSICGVHLDPT